MPQANNEITKDLNLLDVMGTWRVDCSNPTDDPTSEIEFTVTLAGLNVIHHGPNGPFQPTSTITGVKIITPTVFILEIKGGLGASPPLQTTYMIQNKSLQVWASSVVDQIEIEDGKDTTTGHPTPVWQKCF